MSTDTPSRGPRLSAEERRDSILEAAMVEFARRGLYGTSTEHVAARAGVSQPYLFRLFGTKRDLFLATVERGFDRVADAFRLAAESNPEAPLQAMGKAYLGLLTERDQLLLQLQAYAACGDLEVQQVVRTRFGQLFQLVSQLSGAGDAELQEFFSHGMLLNVAAAMNLPSILDEAWAQKCLGDEPM